MIHLTQPQFWAAGAINKPFGWSVLWLISLLYTAIVRIKRALTKTIPLPVKSICVGNVVAGGAGKTPVLIALAHLIGHDRVVFLTRGYGGNITHATLINDTHTAHDVGDEALLLAHHAPVIVGRDRIASAHMAATLFPGRIVLLDDGLQNPSFRATLNLLVWDLYGAGNDHCLPAGPLREPLMDALTRIDAVIAVGGAIPPHRPAFTATGHIPRAPEPTTPVIAFAGIGRPAKFADSLEQAGYVVAGFHPFPDHHRFSDDELQNLSTTGFPLLTTEKDWVRLPAAWQTRVTAVPYTIQFGHPQSLLRWIEDRLI